MLLMSSSSLSVLLDLIVLLESIFGLDEYI